MDGELTDRLGSVCLKLKAVRVGFPAFCILMSLRTVQLLFIEKLRQKLSDYVQKLDDDDNPDNGVEEEEKSKNNPLFCFRLQRLFGIFYGDAYCAMAYKDVSSASFGLSWVGLSCAAP